MKILVTGGKGFIGSKIVEMLCKEHSVTVVDNHDTYGIIAKEGLGPDNIPRAVGAIGSWSLMILASLMCIF